MNKLSRAPQTRVLVLRNMLKSDELDGEVCLFFDEFLHPFQVEAEVTEECENYGKVTKVVIYQERQSADENAEIVVKIFVQFRLNYFGCAIFKVVDLVFHKKFKPRFRRLTSAGSMEIKFLRKFTIKLPLT